MLLTEFVLDAVVRLSVVAEIVLKTCQKQLLETLLYEGLLLSG